MFLFLLREIAKRKSLTRAFLNAELRGHRLAGTVLDVGGGKHRDYLTFLHMAEGTDVQTVDLLPHEQGTRQLNFETDPLPYADASLDQIIVFNVLEHIFNHQFLTNEMRRVLKPGAPLLGFVPFLINYHPDPHDYFRYTKEALQRIFACAGFEKASIKEIGGGPFAVAFNTVALSLPRPVRLALFPAAYALDALFLRLRPQAGERYPLGYFFVLRR